MPGASMNDSSHEPKAASKGCPDRDVLADLALGKLPMGAIETLGRHVEACPTCHAVLESLDNLEDSVVADIKGQTGPLPPDPQLEDQLREAEQVSRIVWGEPQPNMPEEPLPERLGQYEIQERIGRGGMGTVYMAFHTPEAARSHQSAARSTTSGPAGSGPLPREMEAVGQLDHANLVRAHDAGEADGQPFLVMEFLDGIDLAHLVRQRGPLAVANACEVVRQAAQGLQYAHEHGMVHRDVKPSNIMLTAAGQVKVLDLGLAHLTVENSQGDDTTASGQVVGTGDFIAPEQGQDAGGGCPLQRLRPGLHALLPVDR